MRCRRMYATIHNGLWTDLLMSLYLDLDVFFVNSSSASASLPPPIFLPFFSPFLSSLSPSPSFSPFPYLPPLPLSLFISFFLPWFFDSSLRESNSQVFFNWRRTLCYRLFVPFTPCIFSVFYLPSRYNYLCVCVCPSLSHSICISPNQSLSTYIYMSLSQSLTSTHPRLNLKFLLAFNVLSHTLRLSLCPPIISHSIAYPYTAHLLFSQFIFLQIDQIFSDLKRCL